MPGLHLGIRDWQYSIVLRSQVWDLNSHSSIYQLNKDNLFNLSKLRLHTYKIAIVIVGGRIEYLSLGPRTWVQVIYLGSDPRKHDEDVIK